MKRVGINIDNNVFQEDIKIEDLLIFKDELNKAQFLNMFSGIPVIVYPMLAGKTWHIAMSQELYDELVLYEVKKEGE